jgi:hypothetical protein
MKVTAFADFLPFYRQISQRKRGIFCNQKYQGKFFSITRRIFHLPKASANVEKGGGKVQTVVSLSVIAFLNTKNDAVCLCQAAHGGRGRRPIQMIYSVYYD